MAELAGVRVADAIDGEDSAQVGSFFRHVVSGVLRRVRVLNPEFEGEATVFFCGRQANANYKETKDVLHVRTSQMCEVLVRAVITCEPEGESVRML